MFNTEIAHCKSRGFSSGCLFKLFLKYWHSELRKGKTMFSEKMKKKFPMSPFSNGAYEVSICCALAFKMLKYLVYIANKYVLI